MKHTITFYLFTILFSSNSYCQEQENMTQSKHFNSFGLSFDVGGGLRNAKDILTVTTDESVGLLVEAVGSPNFSYGLFWEHQWNFHKKHGLLYGVSASYTSFYCGVRFKNHEYSDFNGQYYGPTNEYVLGDLRHGFASIDFPLSYTYTFNTKIGSFSPSIGVKMKVIAYIPESGRNYGGVSTTTSDINNGDTLYYNNHTIRFGTKSPSPILMPTLGLKYSKGLDNGAKLNVHLNYSFFLKSMNTVETYLSNYDNYENGNNYVFFNSSEPALYNPQTGEFTGKKQSIYFGLDLSGFNIGISYTLSN